MEDITFRHRHDTAYCKLYEATLATEIADIHTRMEVYPDGFIFILWPEMKYVKVKDTEALPH